MKKAGDWLRPDLQHIPYEAIRDELELMGENKRATTEAVVEIRCPHCHHRLKIVSEELIQSSCAKNGHDWTGWSWVQGVPTPRKMRVCRRDGCGACEMVTG